MRKKQMGIGIGRSSLRLYLRILFIALVLTMSKLGCGKADRVSTKNAPQCPDVSREKIDLVFRNAPLTASHFQNRVALWRERKNQIDLMKDSLGKALEYADRIDSLSQRWQVISNTLENPKIEYNLHLFTKAIVGLEHPAIEKKLVAEKIGYIRGATGKWRGGSGYSTLEGDEKRRVAALEEYMTGKTLFPPKTLCGSDNDAAYRMIVKLLLDIGGAKAAIEKTLLTIQEEFVFKKALGDYEIRYGKNAARGLWEEWQKTDGTDWNYRNLVEKFYLAQKSGDKAEVEFLNNASLDTTQIPIYVRNWMINRASGIKQSNLSEMHQCSHEIEFTPVIVKDYRKNKQTMMKFQTQADAYKKITASISKGHYSRATDELASLDDTLNKGALYYEIIRDCQPDLLDTF